MLGMAKFKLDPEFPSSQMLSQSRPGGWNFDRREDVGTVTAASIQMDNVRCRPPEEYRKYAEECERIARRGPPEHKETLLKIAKAWRECAASAEKKSTGEPSSLDGD